jgi:RyR domain
MEVNKILRTSTGLRCSELDLALMRRYVDCARVLIRGKCHAQSFSGALCEELLHRFILMGDGVGAELLLSDPANGVRVSQPVIDLLQRLTYLNACTFSFANHSSPFTQYMYECVTCQQLVCVVCMRSCHGDHPYRELERPAAFEEDGSSGEASIRHALTSQGCMVDAVCGCQKSTCCALGVVDRREAAGYRYVPDPIDVSSVMVETGSGSDLGTLIDKLAWNSHEVWAKDKRSQGWRYGKRRDMKKKLHPQMLPYSRLSEEDKKWDVTQAAELVKVIHALGYRVRRSESAARRLDLLTVGSEYSSAPDVLSLQTPFGEQAHPFSAFPDMPVYPEPVQPSPESGGVERVKRLSIEQERPGTSESQARPRTGGIRVAPLAVDRSPGVDVDGGTAAIQSRLTSDEESGMMYLPRPFDTSSVKISQDIRELVDLLSRHSHEVWARDKIKEGWKYAPDRSQSRKEKAGGVPQGSNVVPQTPGQAKVSPLLVPYEFLTEKEKANTVNSATEMIKTILYLGFEFQRDASIGRGERESMCDAFHWQCGVVWW